MSESLVLFEKHKKVYPRSVSGKYRQLKSILTVVFLMVYYFAAFLRWDRPGDAPDQAILIDLMGRRAYFFFIEIWPQEVYFLTGILILAAVTLFFVTSLFGRVWCGYACFQTVWTDLFLSVERMIQGDRTQRMRLDEAPLSFEKIWKKALTHLCWILIAAATGGAFVLYFNDAPTLVSDILHGRLDWAVGGWILGLTASTYIMAGFAREQVCTYMCPYARFQSGMFDRDTLIISYEADRGEPRAKHKQGESWEGRGHCIDCKQCVVVCPVGIDIRDGLQYQCIACGLCVDACNDVMDRMELPRGLIRYDTANNQDIRSAARAAGQTPPEHFRILRPRTVIYTFLLLAVAAAMLVALLMRAPFELHVLHDRNPLFVQLSDGSVRNSYTVKILNKEHATRSYALTTDDLDGVRMTVVGQSDAVLVVPPDSVGQFRVMLVASPVAGHPRREVELKVRELETGVTAERETMFLTDASRR
jgi:cytochrome c oxidase accessory protein FixG